MQVVLLPFVGYGYNMPVPGELVDVPEPGRSALIESGAIAEYECKIDPLPEVKKNARSE